MVLDLLALILEITEFVMAILGIMGRVSGMEVGWVIIACRVVCTLANKIGGHGNGKRL